MVELPLVLLGFSTCFGNALKLSGAPSPTALATLDARATLRTRMSTCGYLTGDPSKGWAAPKGYDCRVDTSHGLWGFCPTTVIAATDCGLGGYCFDDDNCRSGCGRLSNNPSITTWTCTPSDPSSRFCSFAYLTFGVDQTYDYYHCGPNPGTGHFLALPTAEISTASTTPASTTLSEPSSSSLPARISSLSTSTGASQQTATPETTAKVENIGAIIGGVIGGLALVCGCVVAVVYLKRDRFRRGVVSPPEQTAEIHGQRWIQSTNAKTGGWGPSELPHSEARSPIELPT